MHRLSAVKNLGLPTVCAGLMGVLLLLGGFLWFRPALTTPGSSLAEVPAPQALFVASRLTVPGHQQACEESVTVTPKSQVVNFELFPLHPGRAGGPPIAFSLRASGYQTRTVLRGGYPGGLASLAISPPSHPLIATACFTDIGSRPVQLVGTDEARTVSRSYPMTIAGRAVGGDVSLSFLQSSPSSILHRLGELADHASNLTGGLLSPALVWIIGIIAALGVPAAMIGAVWAALRDNEPVPANR